MNKSVCKAVYVLPFTINPLGVDEHRSGGDASHSKETSKAAQLNCALKFPASLP